MGINLAQIDNTVYGKDISQITNKEIALRNLTNIKHAEFTALIKRLHDANTLPTEKVYKHVFTASDKSSAEVGNINYKLYSIAGLSLPLTSYKDGLTFAFLARASNDTGTIQISIDNLPLKKVFNDETNTMFQPLTIKKDVPYLVMYDVTADSNKGGFRILMGNTSVGSTSVGTVITQTAHGFTFTGVYFDSSTNKWKRAFPDEGLQADAIAVRIDDNTFKAVVSGYVELPLATGIVTDLDTGQTTFTNGEYYFAAHSKRDSAGNFLSVNGKLQDNRGLFSKNRIDRALEQCMFKAIVVESKLFAIVMVTNPPMYNFLDTFEFNRFGGSGILDYQKIEALQTELDTIRAEKDAVQQALIDFQIEYNQFKINAEIDYIKGVNYIDITNSNPAITFNPVTLVVSDPVTGDAEWLPTNLGGQMIADAVALRLTPDKIRIFNNGIVSVPASFVSYCTDDGYYIDATTGELKQHSPEKFVLGSKYYVSPYVVGKFHKYETSGYIQQLAFKVIGKTVLEYRLVVMITDEVQMVR